ncbi:MAG: ribosomal RNA small subunit methyltransferase A [Synergistaceae bacterium]|nr:ribosomal RNA small subunit methyltransferase A [Synergistaceae bacterium]
MIKALKRYGQNFLVDKNILNLIIMRADLKSSDCVLEIGPGQGVLTRELLAQGISYLHAIELDQRLQASLDDLTARADFALHWGDAVKFDYDTLSPFPNKLVANIPYNITTPLIWELIKYASRGLRYYLLMLQKEAALRLTAKPDTKERYPLGIAIEAMGHAGIIHHVSRTCFKPVPKVDSAIVEIVIDRNFELACDDLWRELLHAGFAHRRKTLANNLRGFHDIQDLGDFADIRNMRAEDLTCCDWLKIYHDLRKI